MMLSLPDTKGENVCKKEAGIYQYLKNLHYLPSIVPRDKTGWANVFGSFAITCLA